MRILFSSLSLVLLAAPVRAQDPKTPTWIDDAVQPSYLAAEKVADGIYGVVRGDIISTILPKRVGGESSAPPEDNSFATFSAELSARQARAARRDWEARPAPGALSTASIDAWLASSIAAHRDAVMDAFAASLMERYRVRRFGRASGDLLRDSDNWSVDMLATAAVFGGAYAYFAGVRADFDAGPLKVELDLAPGESLRTLPHGSDSRHLARLALSKRGIPLSLYAEWGPTQAADRVGANWSARF